MASDSISSDSQRLEQSLRDLQPSGLDQDFLDRLEAAADGSLVQLTDTELRFEKALSAHCPAGIDAAFMQRLESLVADVPFPVNDKIVLFPKTAPAKKAPVKKTRPMWAAAAAVALIGGVSALMLPQAKSTSPVADRVIRSTTPSAANPSNFAPAGFNSVADTEDVGLSWQQGSQPHRVYRLTFRDRVTLKDANGKTIEVEQPRTEYILVPEKMD